VLPDLTPADSQISMIIDSANALLAEIHRLRSQVDAKQQLLNYVCHELRGPLHLARLCLDSALATADLTPQCREELGLADMSPEGDCSYSTRSTNTPAGETS